MLTAADVLTDEWPPPHLARPALSEQLNSRGVLPAGITAQWPGRKKPAQRGLMPYCVLKPKVMSTPTLKILLVFFVVVVIEAGHFMKELMLEGKNPTRGAMNEVFNGTERWAV